MKLSDFEKVGELKIELERLIGMHEAALHGRLSLTSNHDGTLYDFGRVLTLDDARNSLSALFACKIETCRGAIRQFGVDANA